MLNHYIELRFINRSTNASAEYLNTKIKAFRAQFRGVKNLEFFLLRLTTIFCLNTTIGLDSKSITAKKLFKRYQEIKVKLWGSKFWTIGFYANTVGQYSNEEIIKAYVKNQGTEKEYKKVHSNQLTLF